MTTEAVREIVALKGVVIQKEIAKRYGISKGQVSRIHTGKRWGWLE